MGGIVPLPLATTNCSPIHFRGVFVHLYTFLHCCKTVRRRTGYWGTQKRTLEYKWISPFPNKLPINAIESNVYMSSTKWPVIKLIDFWRLWLALRSIQLDPPNDSAWLIVYCTMSSRVYSSAHHRRQIGCGFGKVSAQYRIAAVVHQEPWASSNKSSFNHRDADNHYDRSQNWFPFLINSICVFAFLNRIN